MKTQPTCRKQSRGPVARCVLKAFSNRAIYAGAFFFLFFGVDCVAQTSGVTIEEGLVIRGSDWYKSTGVIDPIESDIVAGTWTDSGLFSLDTFRYIR